MSQDKPDVKLHRYVNNKSNDVIVSVNDRMKSRVTKHDTKIIANFNNTFLGELKYLS